MLYELKQSGGANHHQKNYWSRCIEGEIKHANSITESLSLVVEEPDPAVLTASDEGRGSWGVGETSDCC